ncbi:MAG: sulfotransferase [Bacteroidales bacterium]|nr:sulfotransferase [Bacteroidales bacterium]
MCFTNNPNFKKPAVAPDTQKRLDKIITRPIFICGNEKSGTTLLTQLLDGKSNIFALPGDTHFIRKYGENKKLNFENEAKHWTARMINPTGQAPFFPFGKSISVYQNFIN